MRLSILRLFVCPLIAFSVLSSTSDALPQKHAPSATPKDAPAKKEDPLPLKPARKIEFTTSEGTWLSLDVSPDGQTIIFDLLGDLYTVPINGGRAKKLTKGMAFNNQPHYSPDGKTIAYISDAGGAENVWIADVDGSNPKQLSHDEESEFTSPVWSADGNYVIAGRCTQFPVSASELWMYHVRGGAGVQVTKSHTKTDVGPRLWVNTLGGSPSKDGRYLYYASRQHPLGFYNVTLPLSQIVRRDLVTGDEDPVTNAPGSGMRPSSRQTEIFSSTPLASKPRPASASATSKTAKSIG